jgi:uncharacterized membrane protein YkvA (DUF1232 family)
MANKKDSHTKNILDSAATQAKQPGFFQEIWEQIRLVFSLLRDRDVPLYLKVVPFLGIAYMILPPDIIPDFIPVLGQLDDLTILLIGSKMFIELAPQDVVARHIARMRGILSPAVGEGQTADKEPTIIVDPDPQKGE